MIFLYKYFTKQYIYYIYLITKKYKYYGIYQYFIFNTFNNSRYFIDIDKFIKELNNISAYTIYIVNPLIFQLSFNTYTNDTNLTYLIKTKFINFYNHIFKNNNIDTKIKILHILNNKILIVFNTYNLFLQIFRDRKTFENFIISFKYFNIILFIADTNLSYKYSLDLFLSNNNIKEYKTKILNVVTNVVNTNIKFKNFKIKKFINFYLYNGIQYNLTPEYVNNIIKCIKNIKLKHKKTELSYIYLYLYRYFKTNNNLLEPVVKSINNMFYNTNENKPLGNFLLCGTSGTGKTELAKILSYILFKSTKYLIKLNMSEYMEKHSISKIIGSPPGYVGYNDSNEFINKVKSYKMSIILFDEIEKAHKSINDLMLQILEEGKLTLANGDLLKFNNSFVIFTSNLGCDGDILTCTNREIYNYNILNSIKNFFRPEFISRLNNILLFNPIKLSMCFTLFSSIQKKLNILNSINIDYIDYFLQTELIKYSYNMFYGLRPLYKLNELLFNKIKEHINKFSKLNYKNNIYLLNNIKTPNFKYYLHPYVRYNYFLNKFNL
uniref:ClpC1 n=1 Tax=Babesia sp. Dunhuang TaxID=1164853 RepID=A0A411AD59_9APIC|nr:ClpC1 [Babesia sp. Xinjiang]QAX26987.1 ClpC1 [Babesia sp. Xinjiang]QAX27018.1 ClpC1 [Babesia sp. Dunhuang]